MKTNLYLSNCPKCRKKTEHLIFSINRAGNLKLQCLKCGKIKGRYYNPDSLEFKLETNFQE